jgi:hypothetical protein
VFGLTRVLPNQREKREGLQYLAGYLTLRPDGWLEPTTERSEATHAHAVDPASGDLIVVTIAEAAAMERPREVVLGGDTLTIYGV